MRIAQIAPIIERVPPKKYGGTERVVSALTEELVKRGHDVTLFASGDSVTTGHLVSVYPKSLREARFKDMYGLNVYTFLNIGLAFQNQFDFDIIHDHNGLAALPTSNIARVQTLMTMHGPFTPDNRSLFQTLSNVPIVTISKAQARYTSGINNIGTVHNGLPLEDYPFSEEHDDYLLFVGRISLEKGVHYAIETALSLKHRLIIAAKLDSVDRPYFQEYVEPYLSSTIEWIGEVDEEERNRLMSRAAAFLHPVTWEEPFGLTLIEAMACGCPVIAIGKGAIPEIIEDGKTGFVVTNVEEMAEAVGRLPEISRKACRDHALNNFSTEKMTSGYEEIYKTLLREKA